MFHFSWIYFFVGCSSGGAVSRVVYNIAADNKHGAGIMFAKIPWIFRWRILTIVKSLNKKSESKKRIQSWTVTGQKLLQTPAKIILWNTELVLCYGWGCRSVEKKWINSIKIVEHSLHCWLQWTIQSAALTAAGPERRRQRSGTYWRRGQIDATADPGCVKPAIWQQLLFLASKALGGWGHWRQSIERGRTGSVRSIFIWDFNFILDCFSTAVWCSDCAWWQFGSAEVENVGMPVGQSMMGTA